MYRKYSFIYRGWDTIHWSSVGNRAAPDSKIMAYAKTHGYVILTHSLDFSTMLAATQGTAPSVLNIHIDNAELEESIKQTYGDETKSMARAFFDFIQQQKMKQDIGVSIEQLETGEGIALNDVMKDIRAKYE